MSRLRARCPDCRTLTAVAIGPDYECHACGRSWSAGLVRVPRAWGEGGPVRIAETVEEWVDAIGKALADEDRDAWLARVDARLARTSWERTWAEMDARLDGAADGRLEPIPGMPEVEHDGLAAAAGD